MPDAAAVSEVGRAKPRPELLQIVVVADLVESWRQDFGIDVADHFDGLSTLRLYRDLETGHRYFDPPRAGTGSFYSRMRAFPWYHPEDKAEHRLAATLIGPGERVLEIGAGDGAFAGRLRGVAYQGLELDLDCVRRARALGRDVSGRGLASLAAEVAGGRRPPFTVLAAFQVLEHLAEPDAFLSEGLRCLAPGGQVILGLPDNDSYLGDLPDFVLNAPPHHLTWWNEPAVAALLRRHGLENPAFYRPEVEPWERRLWWMARVARALGRGEGARFGARHRARKACSWIVSGMLQAMRPPAAARGATLVATARAAS